MKVLVVGGKGFIGSHVVDRLLERGHDVAVFDTPRKKPAFISCESTKLTMIEGDFTKGEDLGEAIKAMDAVIHLAWTTTPATAERDPGYDIVSNVLGTVRMLQMAVQHGVGKIVFSSSGGTVYGESDVPLIAENHQTSPLCTYGASKLAVEKYLEVFQQKFGLDYAVLRPANPYGERQDVNSGVGAITKFLSCAVNGHPITIWGDGSVARDFFYVGDLADAFVAALEKPTPSRIYNIASGANKTLNEIIEIIKSITGKSPDIRYDKKRSFDVKSVCLDISRARRELGWYPKVSLSDGIRRTYEWIKLI